MRVELQEEAERRRVAGGEESQQAGRRRWRHVNLQRKPAYLFFFFFERASRAIKLVNLAQSKGHGPRRPKNYGRGRERLPLTPAQLSPSLSIS